MIRHCDLRGEQIENCLLCGQQGTVLYEQLRDRLFQAPGDWHLLRCLQCGLVWLTPQPLDAEVGKLYGTYYTHEAQDTSLRTRLRDAVLMTAMGAGRRLPIVPWRMLGAILYLVPTVRTAARTATLHLGEISGKSLLDVGCGGGRLLRLMRDRGWEVEGVEPDPTAAELTRQTSKIPVHVSPAEKLDVGEKRFDVVTMNHVLEHLRDPIAGLRACWRTLTAGGQLVVLTPNVESLGHRFFRQDCIFLDPPRHLYLFTAKTLQKMVERAGFRVEMLRTSTRLAGPTWVSSSEIRRSGKRQTSGTGTWAMLHGIPFSVIEKTAHLFSPGVGEEIVLIARKPCGDLLES